MNDREIEAANTKRGERLKAANTERRERLRGLRRKGSMTEKRRLSSTEGEGGQERKFSSFWDPEDITTWVDFMHYELLYGLIPIFRPLKSGKEIFPCSIFELYRMEMKTLYPPRRKDFDMVILHSESTRYVPLVIYKRPPLPLPLEEEEIKDIIGRPLPLKGPGRLPSAEKPVTIILNNPIEGSNWCFGFDPVHHSDHKYNEPLYRKRKDEDSGSEVLVFYEIIEEAVKATLVFRFMKQGEGEGERGQPIQILSGTISAADHRNPSDTKRIVKHFQKSHKQPALAYTNDMLTVDRHVFGVPCGSRFEVTVDLECTTLVGGRGRREQGSPFTISGTQGFDVPTHTRSDNQFFTSTGSTSLRLTVSWGLAGN